jgi:hypothetical protein
MAPPLPLLPPLAPQADNRVEAASKIPNLRRAGIGFSIRRSVVIGPVNGDGNGCGV